MVYYPGHEASCFHLHLVIKILKEVQQKGKEYQQQIRDWAYEKTWKIFALSLETVLVTKIRRICWDIFLKWRSTCMSIYVAANNFPQGRPLKWQRLGAFIFTMNSKFPWLCPCYGMLLRRIMQISGKFHEHSLIKYYSPVRKFKGTKTTTSADFSNNP